MSDRDNTSTAAALILLAGGIIGAGLALLYAPQAGEKTRKDLERYAKKARKKGREAAGVVEDFTEQLSDMIETIGERAAEILEKGEDLAYGAKKGVLKAMEEGEERLEKQRSRLRKLIG